MTMPPGIRKFALTAHVTCSIGWLGVAASFLAMALAGLRSTDAVTVRGFYIAMDVVARFVLVPLALGALITGLVQALGTTWGLFRHYWVVIKLVITAIAGLVLLSELAPIGTLAAVAAQRPIGTDDFREERMSLIVHAGGGVLVLLIPTVLSIYKPRGTTRYGRRAAATARS